MDAAKRNADVFIKLNTPSAGTHVLTVQPGQIIEVVIQNDRAGYLGGEYSTTDPLTSSRNGREQHSFHLHGYHFWQVGDIGRCCREPSMLRVPEYSNACPCHIQKLLAEGILC